MRRVMNDIAAYITAHLTGRNIGAFLSGFTFVAGITVFLASAFAGAFLIGTPWWHYSFFGMFLGIALLVIGSATEDDDEPKPVPAEASNG